ncbi:MAG: hypothetical protein LBB36_01680, partial [Fibromonadaceae bacterium]|nr:hypothetical protein [Fibromonadaceae bacterium]
MWNLKRERVVIAWILAMISILPILFIVWMSLLNAEDIKQSVFFPQKRNNKVTFFAPQENSQTEIAATSLGHIYAFSSRVMNYRSEEIADINSVATVYTQKGSSLWAFSANRGLVEIDLNGKTEKSSYDWNFFKNNYENFDHSSFSVSSDVLPEHFAWLANNLNFEPALPSGKDNITISSLTGIKFYPSEEIIMQLNVILTNKKALNTIIDYWKKWDGWLNPQIHRLFKIKNPSEKEKSMLFRFCLSELFPNKISRFRYFSW